MSLSPDSTGRGPQGWGEPNPAGEADPYRRALEGMVRLQETVDPGHVAEAAASVLKASLGPVSGYLFYSGEDGAPRLQSLNGGCSGIDGAPDQAVSDMLAEAASSGRVVRDDGFDGSAVAVPVAAGGEVVGALYVKNAAHGTCRGPPNLDLLAILGRHVGSALKRSLGGGGAADGLSLREARRAFEEQLVCSRMRSARGNIAKAARTLAMDRGQLSRLLKRYGIDRNSFR